MQKSFAVMQKGDYGSRAAERRDVQKPVQKVVQKKCPMPNPVAVHRAEPRAVVRADDCADKYAGKMAAMQKQFAEMNCRNRADGYSDTCVVVV